MREKPVLDFIYFDAGGGHRSAATALQSVIQAQGLPWEVHLLNLQEVLDSLDIFRKLTGIRLQDIYNLLLAKGWTLGSRYLLPLMHGVIRIYHPAQVKLLSQVWRDRRPDMVVSLVPNFNRALYQSLQKSTPGVPLVTILTDLADFPPHFWMERQPQYFVCGTERAVEQALAMGHSRRRVFRASGMILRPQFYESWERSREQGRQVIGLDPEVPTGLVLFGGQGSNVMYEIAERLGNSRQHVQLIMVCGKNEKLRERLARLRMRNKILVEGFTREIPNYMRLADFFIGKPGPGSISEAIRMGLPVIVERNNWTLPQERYNAEWIIEHGVGIVLENFRGINQAITDLLSGDVLPRMKQAITCLDNRAAFEIPLFLKQVLEERAAVGLEHGQ